jgi:predicted 3-demethylubiquinone-9 3-methyltransferase (glyoxalase superfamily)
MATIKQRITSCLWFDTQAEQAAKFYTSVFPGSAIGQITRYGKEGYEFHKQPEGAVMTVSFQLSGMAFTGLNGGPQFNFNPSISFFVVCETEAETDMLWHNLAEGGNVLMPLDKYDWSEKYGWVQDQFGVCWEIAFGKISDVGQKIAPAFLFTGKQQGRAEEAVSFYTSVFDESEVVGILKYGAGEKEPEGTVKHAQFRLQGQTFMAIDSALPHSFAFNEAISMVVHCATQKEVDHYWSRLTEGGEEGPCGWLKDTFGVSWQIVPVVLTQMLEHPDAARVQRVTKAFLQMKKFNIAQLEQAFEE